MVLISYCGLNRIDMIPSRIDKVRSIPCMAKMCLLDVNEPSLAPSGFSIRDALRGFDVISLVGVASDNFLYLSLLA